MSFNISQFKSNIDRYGGPAHTSLFEVQIIPPAVSIKSGLTPRELTFFCKTANVPGITVRTETLEQIGQMPRQFPVGMDNQQFNTIFMLDSDHQVVSYFHSWIQSVVNYGSKGGSFAEVDGQLPFEMGYKDEYSCRMIIKYYSTRGKIETYYETILDGCYPTIIGDIDLAWENNDSYGTLPVAFAYDRIAFSGEKVGVVGTLERFGRGSGLLSLLESVGSIGQTIEQGFRPTGIQDAINRFTRVRDDFDNISKIFR